MFRLFRESTSDAGIGGGFGTVHPPEGRRKRAGHMNATCPEARGNWSLFSLLAPEQARGRGDLHGIAWVCVVAHGGLCG